MEYSSERVLGQELIAGSTFFERLTDREHIFGISPARPNITEAERIAAIDSLKPHVGDTPLDRWDLPNGSTVWVKDESENPYSESHYDRATVTVFDRLIKEGLLPMGATILEGTSGSAGRSFASVARYLGHPVHMLIPNEHEFPEARRRDIAALGATTERVVKSGGIGEVIHELDRRLATLKVKDGYNRQRLNLEGQPIFIFKKNDHIIVAPNHSEIIITPNAFRSIGYEVAAQIPQNVAIDTFIGTLGNGTTVKGITEALKDIYGDVRVIGVETAKSPSNAIRKIREGLLISTGRFPREAFKKYNGKADEQEAHQALGDEFQTMYGFPMPEADQMTYHDSFGASTPGQEPKFIEVENIDYIIPIEDEWRDLKRRVNTYAYLMGNVARSVGNTSSENLYLAIKIAEQRPNQNILVLKYDKGDQYEDWPPKTRRYTYPIPKPSPEIVPFILN